MPISAGDLAVMNKGRVCGRVLRCKEKRLPYGANVLEPLGEKKKNKTKQPELLLAVQCNY